MTKFAEDPDNYLQQAEEQGDSQTREKLEEIADVLIDGRCTSYEECIAWARHKFQVRELFVDFSPSFATFSSTNVMVNTFR